MKFWEAMKLFDEGAKVRSKSWPPDEFICNFGFNCRAQSLWSNSSNLYFCFVSNDWELYQEPVQLLSFAEVLQGLKEGKKFKRKEWQHEDEVLRVYSSGVVDFQGSREWKPQVEDFDATDWIEVK